MGAEEEEEESEMWYLIRDGGVEDEGAFGEHFLVEADVGHDGLPLHLHLGHVVVEE